MHTKSKYFLGFAHVGIFTNRYEETIHFFTEVLPFKVIKVLHEEQPENKGGLYPMDCTFVRLNDLFVEIMRGADNRNHDGVIGVYDHMGISVSNMDEAVAYLREKGQPEDKIGDIRVNDTFNPPKTQRMCPIYGPNGEKVTLYEWTNKEFYDLKD